MQSILTQLLAAGIVMGILDALWLSVIANSLYKKYIGKLLLDKPNMTAAIAFYVVYIIGVVAFVTHPAIDAQSWQYALGMGALFGFVAYATYDLTNLATLRSWPVKLVVIDLIWGTCLTAVTGIATYATVTTLL